MHYKWIVDFMRILWIDLAMIILENICCCYHLSQMDNRHWHCWFFKHHFVESGSQSRFVYLSASVSQTYLLTFYAPASACPWYTNGNGSRTTNCWMSLLITSKNVPLSSKKLYSIDTSAALNTSIYLGLQSSPSLGNEIFIKEAGYGSSFNIHMQNTNNDT